MRWLGSSKTRFMPSAWNTIEPIENISAMVETNISHNGDNTSVIKLIRS